VAEGSSVSDAISVWPQTAPLEDLVRAKPDNPYRRRLVADDAARAAIAKALDLVALERLEAELAVRGWFDGVTIEGRWSAEIVQICGVSLEPFPTVLEGEFTVRAVPAGSLHAPAPDAEIVVDPEADDPPDVLDTGVVDLGGYVVEHLALEIDPFPRKPDAVFEPPEAPAELSPFAVLRGLKPDGGAQ
jgi:uncharacterized metal-binding protein YceD (DUF177 family)